MAAKNKLEIVFGVHAVKSALASTPENIITLYVQKHIDEKHDDNILNDAKEIGLRTEFVDKAWLEKRSNKGRHQGYLIERKTTALTKHALEDFLEWSSDKPPLFLILDCIQDPHNLGACLRTADACGVTAVILPKDKSVGITPTVRKVASGAAENVKIIEVVNLARAMKQMQSAGVWVYGTSDKAQSTLYDIELLGPIALVMGNEESGIRHGTEQNCDYMMSIPMRGSVESLNVSVATSVVLYEVLRQRL